MIGPFIVGFTHIEPQLRIIKSTITKSDKDMDQDYKCETCENVFPFPPNLQGLNKHLCTLNN